MDSQYGAGYGEAFHVWFTILQWFRRSFSLVKKNAVSIPGGTE